MLPADEFRAFAGLLQRLPTADALSPERQQELLLKGIVAALEEAIQREAEAGENVSAEEIVTAEDAAGLLRVTAASHPLESVRAQAISTLLRLTDAGRMPAVDELYRLAVEDGILAARQAILTRGWQPSRPALRALFDWFTHLESAAAFPEEELPLLTLAFEQEASPTLRRRLLATAPQNHAENWARIVEAFENQSEAGLQDLVQRYPFFRPNERAIALDLLDQLAGQVAPAAAREAARSALSLLFIRYEDPHARELILDHNYLPEDSGQRALFLFLAEAWELYESLDFNHNLLVNAYESAGRSMRRRLLEHSRQTGQMEWLHGLSGAGAGGVAVRWLSDLTDADWDLSIRRLTEREAFAELWRLSQVAPPVWSAVILDRLARREWNPVEAEEQVGFLRLTALARESLSSPLAIKPQKILHAPPIAEITCLAIHPGGRLLVAGGNDQYIYQWDLPDGRRVQPMILPAQVTRAIAFSPDGSLLAAASGDHRIRALHLANEKMFKPFEGHRAMIRALAVHPDGRTLYSAGFDSTIRFWRFPHGTEIKVLRPGPGEIFSMVLSATGSHLISAGADALVRVWTLPEGVAARELAGHTDTVTHLSASSTSELVASAGRDGAIRLWNYSSGGLVRALESGSVPLTSICLHPNDQVLVGGRSNGEIVLWNLSTGRIIDQLPGHRKPVIGLVFSPKGDTLYSADSSGNLQVWDLRTFLAIRLPGEVARPGAADELQARLNDPGLSSSEKKWLGFSTELARWRQRYDIELADFAVVQIGEFDIEL